MSTSDVFISYVSEDRGFAKVLAEELEAEGYSVWWDRELIAGQDFSDQIDKQLKTARAVVVIWSPASVASRWVRGEAETGANRRRLIQVLADGLTPELLPSAGLRTIQTVDFDDRPGILTAIAAMLDRKPGAQHGRSPGQSLARFGRVLRRNVTLPRVAIFALILAATTQVAFDYANWQGFRRRSTRNSSRTTSTRSLFDCMANRLS